MVVSGHLTAHINQLEHYENVEEQHAYEELNIAETKVHLSAALINHIHIVEWLQHFLLSY